MFIEVSTSDGSGTQRIAVEAIYRLRPSFGAADNPNTTVIDYADRRFFTRDGLAEVLAKIGNAIRLARLTTPVNTPVHLAAAKVSEIREPATGQHEPATRAVVRVAGKDQQVTEEPAAARQIIDQALA